ncbi:MAG: NAD(P)/FAD-dependent oxidoreductase [Clostridia bacterium]|nr:NAD(P)/FAD-dependent oxidoreductase [Clostridia bacterium]
MIISDIKLKINESETLLYERVCQRLGYKPAYFRIAKKSLDARKKNDLCFVYSVEVADTSPQEEIVEKIDSAKIPSEPIVVVGSGPCGLFCALRLIERGFAPVVIERGKSVDERVKSCDNFFINKVLDTESNIQFGEGGAGTFSDGKLNTQTHSPLIKKVLGEFVRFGAPEEIAYLNKAHIGSDKLKTIVKNMRLFIEKNGGRVLFNTKLTDFTTKNGKIDAITVTDKSGNKSIKVSALVLAIGHSARDTYKMLYNKGVAMRSKDFAVGVRIEHLQSQVGRAQYGELYTQLPPADYKGVYANPDRSAFTFCMCPGGVVVSAQSEENTVVTNGMSNYARDLTNANSALVLQVKRADFERESLLDGINFLRQIERQAFIAGGEDYRAPAVTVQDFLAGQQSKNFGGVLPTYALGVKFASPEKYLPDFITATLKKAIPDIAKRLKFFASPDALITGPETRTSSPIKIEREQNGNSVSFPNLYPAGEGAGYSGGITSSAVDGIKTADYIYTAINQNEW